MPYRQLYVWVEGGDDELFFNRVVRPLLASRYNLIEVVPYAQRPPTWRGSYIRNIRSNAGCQLHLRD